MLRCERPLPSSPLPDQSQAGAPPVVGLDHAVTDAAGDKLGAPNQRRPGRAMRAVGSPLDQRSGDVTARRGAHHVLRLIVTPTMTSLSTVTSADERHDERHDGTLRHPWSRRSDSGLPLSVLWVAELNDAFGCPGAERHRQSFGNRLGGPLPRRSTDACCAEPASRQGSRLQLTVSHVISYFRVLMDHGRRYALTGISGQAGPADPLSTP
jgi:hypothetical protein